MKFPRTQSGSRIKMAPRKICHVECLRCLSSPFSLSLSLININRIERYSYQRMTRLEIMRSTNTIKFNQRSREKLTLLFHKKFLNVQHRRLSQIRAVLKFYYKCLRFFLCCCKYLRAKLKLRPSREKNQNM